MKFSPSGRFLAGAGGFNISTIVFNDKTYNGSFLRPYIIIWDLNTGKNATSIIDNLDILENYRQEWLYGSYQAIKVQEAILKSEIL